MDSEPEPDPDPMKRKFLDPNPIGSGSGSYPTVSTLDERINLANIIQAFWKWFIVQSLI